MLVARSRQWAASPHSSSLCAPCVAIARACPRPKARTFISSARVLDESAQPAVSTTPPQQQQRQSRWKTFPKRLGRVTLVTVIGTVGAFVYFSQKEKYPPPQLPFDASKKTLVILGSGWGATSLLRSLDTTDYNVIVVSPKNYFLFTPLLPSVAVGTLSPRSIIQPTRYLTRHKSRVVSVIEADAIDIDPARKTVTIRDESEIKGKVSQRDLSYDMLVVSVGAEVQTFGIPGVQEHACFMKELHDAEKTLRVFLDCVETAAFPGQSQEEIDRLLHVVVVGGGPTGIELSGELHDFLEEDLRQWYPELAGRIKLTLIEALPTVLPMFSKQLIDYTESTFKASKIDILTKTMVKGVNEKTVLLQMPDKSMQEMPYGMLVWAGGNKARQIALDLMAKFPHEQKNKRGITIDDHLVMKGVPDSSIYAIGDCMASQYAPTAQVASQQGAYLARVFKRFAKRDQAAEKLVVAQQKRAEGNPDAPTEEDIAVLEKQYDKQSKIRPFHYTHQGSLAYIGSEKAIADLSLFNGNLATGGVATYLFWRSVYLSTLFSMRNRVLVTTDWLKVKLFGRDVSRD